MTAAMLTVAAAMRNRRALATCRCCARSCGGGIGSQRDEYVILVESGTTLCGTGYSASLTPVRVHGTATQLVCKCRWSRNPES
jgi:hypothetical protein